MVGTGSEMNAGAVITNHDAKLKIGHVFADEEIMPKFSILNPKYTLTLPRYQMISGIYDIFNHICEQYFSGEDDNTSDYISEGLMKSVRFAKNVWDVDATGKTDEQIASEGLVAMENWMKELGLVLNITELGATEDMLPADLWTIICIKHVVFTNSSYISL